MGAGGGGRRESTAVDLRESKGAGPKSLVRKWMSALKGECSKNPIPEPFLTGVVREPL